MSSLGHHRRSIINYITMPHPVQSTPISSPDHLRSSIFNYITMPHPRLMTTFAVQYSTALQCPPSLINRHELTRPPPQFNTQLSYNSPPSLINPHQLTGPPHTVQYSSTLQCPTLWSEAPMSSPNHPRSSIFNCVTMSHPV
jgi:hypothetical protein